MSNRLDRTRRPGTVGWLAALCTAILLAAAFVTPATAATTVSGTGLQLLARLTTAAERPAGYDRALFVLWVDADHDGCDTREEVLIAESRTTAHTGTGCAVSGSWRSAYDGLTTTTASKFDIDHVVPLKEAWDSGAYGWTAARRQSYANDLGDSRSLRAVSAASNRSKGDKDPAQWLPPLKSFRCTYATDWVVVKVRWRLTVDSAERAALRGLLTACPVRTSSVVLQPVPVSQVATPTPTSSPSPTPTGTATASPSPTPAAPTSACDPNYAGYCVPIVPYDLDCSDIRHRVTVIGVDIHHFDGDNDGIGCESYP